MCFIYIWHYGANGRPWIVTIARLRLRSQIRWWPTQSVESAPQRAERVRSASNASLYAFVSSIAASIPLPPTSRTGGPDRARASIHHDKWHLESLHHFVPRETHGHTKKGTRSTRPPPHGCSMGGNVIFIFIPYFGSAVKIGCHFSPEENK